MSEWCQNKDCCRKRTQNQIRGSKGNKYYQSNKVSGYYKYWCSIGCRETWFQKHSDTCMNTVGFIDKQVLPLEDAWYVEYFSSTWGWNDARQEQVETTSSRYCLINKLKGIKRVITRQQAQTPKQIADDYNYATIDTTQAKELAITLGLAS